MSEKTNGQQHETTDAPPRVPLIFILITIIVVVLGSLGMLALMNTVWQPPATTSSQAEKQAEESARPELQQNPEAELESQKRRMRQRLNSSGWVDQQAGIVHIPIDRAMDLLVERGLPLEAWQSEKTESQ